MKSRMNKQIGAAHEVTSLGFRIVVPMFALAGLSMGNQSCQQPVETTRALKMNVELGSIKGRQVTMPTGEKIDFPYVANTLFYRQVINHDHFVIANAPPTSLALAASKGSFKTQMSKDSSSSDVAPDGMVSAKDVSVLDAYGLLKNTRNEGAELMAGTKTEKEVVQGKASETAVSALPACLYEMPQATLGGEVISFEATWGAGLGVGYNTGGDLSGGLGAKVNFSSSKLELGLRTDDPLTQQVVAIGDGVSTQSKVNFGVDFSAGLPIGLDFFYNTPITDVIRTGMTDGLDQIVKKYKTMLTTTNDWNDVWETRVIYDPEIVNGDTHVAIGAGYRAGVQVGDTFNLSNLHYAWEGAACYTRLKYKIPLTTTPIATGEVVSVGDNVAVLKITYLIEQRIQPGAQVKVLKLKAAPKAAAPSTSKQASSNPVSTKSLR
ncbi:hypothetical protein BH10BDE1_BH10BDE1_05600 [soil metagenome]